MKKFNVAVVVIAIAYVVLDFNAYAEVTKTDCKAMDSSSRKMTKAESKITKEDDQKKTKAQ